MKTSNSCSRLHYISSSKGISLTHQMFCFGAMHFAFMLWKFDRKNHCFVLCLPISLYSWDSFLTHLGTLDLLLAYKGVSKKKVGFFRVTQTRKLGQTLLEVCFSPRPLPLPSSFPFLAFSLTFSPLSFFPLVTNFLYQSSSSKNKIQFSFIDLKLEVQNLGCVICSWYTHR